MIEILYIVLFCGWRLEPRIAACYHWHFATSDNTPYIAQCGSCHRPVDSRERYGVHFEQGEYPYLLAFIIRRP
jgi:hypothetical protein